MVVKTQKSQTERAFTVLVTGENSQLWKSVRRALRSSYTIIDLAGKSLSDQKIQTAVEGGRSQTGQRLVSFLHLAADTDPGMEQSRHLLGLVQALAPVEQFILVSTLRSPVLLRDEVEKFFGTEPGSIPLALLQAAVPYDDGCNSHRLAQMIRGIYEHDSFSGNELCETNENSRLSFIHFKDLARCIRRTIEYRHELGPVEVLTAAEPEQMTLAQLRQRLNQLLHKGTSPLPTLNNLAAPHSTDEAYSKAIQRTRDSIGWEPVYRLNESLEIIISRLKENSQKWYQANGLPVSTNETLHSVSASI